MSICTLCPRKCGVDRSSVQGFCGAGMQVTIARVMLHQWEEPCICTKSGSGAVFFSGCQLRCVFCQNHNISFHLQGKTYSEIDLIKVFLDLQKQGACNINLVSPTPYLDTIIPALYEAKKEGLAIPVMMNSGGYEKVDTLKRLDGLVDIYLPDYKFYSQDIAKEYAKAKDYAAICESALQEMHRQVGKPLFEENSLKRGVIIRHLVLPGTVADSLSVIRRIEALLPKEDVILSLLRQYTPLANANNYPLLKRKITTLEYQKVVGLAEELGFPNIYTQEKESASDAYIPDFLLNNN